MKDFFIDCPSGLASDMLLAAFLDLGLPENQLEKSFKLFGLGEIFSFKVKDSNSYGLRGSATYLDRIISFNDQYKSWPYIRDLVSNSALKSSIKQRKSVNNTCS